MAHGLFLRRILGNITIYRKINRYLESVFRKKLPEKVSIIAVGERESAHLNRIYRKKNKATNVLSFYYGKDYGEILVCPAVVRREAKALKNSFDYQMTWMILHAMLHLSGLHHEKSPMRERQSIRVEKRILGQLFSKKQSARR